jgi:hypothetical protein
MLLHLADQLLFISFDIFPGDPDCVQNRGEFAPRKIYVYDRSDHLYDFAFGHEIPVC